MTVVRDWHVRGIMSAETLKERVRLQRDELPGMYGDIDFDLVPERLALGPDDETDFPPTVKVSRQELLGDTELIDVMATATMLGDVVCDAYVARMPDFGMQRLIEMVRVACRDGLDAVEDPPEELVTFIQAMEAVPEWIDPTWSSVVRAASACRPRSPHPSASAVRSSRRS
jgi:hypothetical protein